MSNLFNIYINYFSEKILEYSPRITASLAIIIGSLLLAVFIRKTIDIINQKKEFKGKKKEIGKLISSAASATIIITGSISALGTIGVNVSALIAGLGLSGFALGFALRDALSNLLSGILIIIYQPFSIGDRIVVSGFEGDVIEINLRYTVIDSPENIYLIPNANIFNNTVTVRKNKGEKK